MKKEDILTNAPRSAPRIVEISMPKKRYSEPKLYIPRKNGRPTVDPGHRWYVYFYWRTDPKKELDRKFTYTRGLNRLKTVKERRAAGNELKDAYRDALERGWNPETKTVAPDKSRRNSGMTLGKAMEYAFEIKKKGGKKELTLNGYEFHMNRFLDWSKQQGYYGLNPKEFTIDQFYEFLDWLRFDYVNEQTQEPVSGSSVNNHKASLSALFTTMKNERLIDVNFIKDIPKVDAEVVNNKAFSVEDLKRIKAEMEKSDPYMIPFFSFVLYPLLRPIEICRLKVRDINTNNWILSVETKTDVLSHRRIIKKMQPVIDRMDLEKYPGDFHLFTNADHPKDWSDAKLKSRADSFGERFRKIKRTLGYGREYGIYSGRHTAILDLYNSMVSDGLGEQEILFKLMPITQHRSVMGIKNYLRKHKKSLPPDHSNIYTIDF